NVTATRNQLSLAASSLFSYSDADNDAAVKYDFYDASGNGHFVFNGAAQPAATVIEITAAQLAQTSYQVGGAADQLYMRANDGFDWGAWSPFVVTPPINHAP